jgi:hypothetical protein
MPEGPRRGPCSGLRIALHSAMAHDIVGRRFHLDPVDEIHLDRVGRNAERGITLVAITLQRWRVPQEPAQGIIVHRVGRLALRRRNALTDVVVGFPSVLAVAACAGLDLGALGKCQRLNARCVIE